ncbi:MAG: phosphoribosylaminoimidazolesuccinocarboxamide synthase [Bacteroidales bacterium]|nr:phosphoribosylaminoimidazolesuccinocarboxamide synthase [Bacteroidales bacterium]
MAGKDIVSTDTKGVIIMHFNDQATAFGGIKRARIKEKGICCNRISSIIFKTLADAGIPNHFLEVEGPRDMKCIKVSPLPFQIVIRNRLAGSTAIMLGVNEGTSIPNTIFEFRYRCSELGKPMINEHHVVALGLATYEELEMMKDMSKRVNDVVKDLFHKAGIELVDIKLRFGRTADGRIILADEISPDNCRLWDESDGRILDKDRFRHDMSDVTVTYKEVMDRLVKVAEV